MEESRAGCAESDLPNMGMMDSRGPSGPCCHRDELVILLLLLKGYGWVREESKSEITAIVVSEE